MKMVKEVMSEEKILEKIESEKKEGGKMRGEGMKI